MTGAALSRIRVIVVDDDRLLRETVADLLRAEPDIEVVGLAADAESGADVAAAEQPDVAVVDVRMPGGGPAAARGIRSVSRWTRVLALSASEESSSVQEMIRAGAVGYVVKGGPAAETVAAVRHAAAGRGHLSVGVTKGVVDKLADKLDEEERAQEQERELQDRVEKALAPGAIRPVYQPIVDLERGRIAGVEALARFDLEPRRTPDLWFADAGKVGQGVQLEIAAIRAQIRAFDEPALGWAYLALNISPEAALRGDVFEELTGLPWDRIVLEMTEHARVDDYAALASALSKFRGEGGRLSVDDAGAGFASLRHIDELDPDFIKLDIRLTRDIDTNSRRRALARALTSFATDVGRSVIAEGIETESELETLRSLGVGFGQGYFLRRPGTLAEALLPIEAITAPEPTRLRPYAAARPADPGRETHATPERSPRS